MRQELEGEAETKMFLGMFVLGLVSSQRLQANVNESPENKKLVSDRRMAVAS